MNIEKVRLHRAADQHRMGPAVAAHALIKHLALISIAMALAGCGGTLIPNPWSATHGGTLRVDSLTEEPVTLTGRFPTAVYADRQVETSFFLADRPLDQILGDTSANAQVVHVELLWLPRAGATPIEDSATNASIRYIIFAEGEMGIYAGAGFARPRGKPGDDSFGLAIRDASLKLVDSTPGFNDLLTPARFSGSFGARLDNHDAAQLQHAVSQRVTNKLGRSRIVDNESLADQYRSITLLNH